jgi:hypothetical protein
MQTKPDIPAGLFTFASLRTGTYADRYDAILEEAFARHRLFLSAHALRQLAGGGSNTVAQEAVERFRIKLHDALASRIEFGADIPEAVATRLSAAAADLLDHCRRSAAGELEAERAALASREEQMRLQVDQATATATEARSALIEVRTALDATREQLKTANHSLVDAATQVAELQKERDAQRATIEAQTRDMDRLAADLREARTLVQQLHEQHAAEKDAVRREHAVQMSESRREHAEALKRAIDDRDAARHAEARERAGYAEATIAAARMQQQLEQAARQAAQLGGERDAAIARAQETAEKLAEARGAAERHAQDADLSILLRWATDGDLTSVPRELPTAQGAVATVLLKRLAPAPRARRS